MHFLGIDLGWQSGASGLCCLALENQTLSLVALTRRDTKAEVLDWVDAVVPAGEPAMIAIDAPTVIPNATGMRLPDRLAHRYFGKYDAGCYPANQGRPFAEALVQFSQALEARGFAQAPTVAPQQVGPVPD
jgi:predicted RNase H-like nuclease